MALRQAKFTAVLTGISTLTFGRMFQSERREKESAAEHDLRCWQERMHHTDEGLLMVQPGAIKYAIEDAARLASDKVKGKGAAKFTTRIRGGLFPINSPPQIISKDGTPIKYEDVPGRLIAVPSDGKKGGTTRVTRKFPELDPPWEVFVAYRVIDADLIQSPEKILEYLESAGLQVGIGCHRPGKSGGDHGQFLVKDFKFEVLAEPQ